MSIAPRWLTSSLATVALLTLGSGCIVGFKVDSDSATAGDMPDKNSSDAQSASDGSSSSGSDGSSSGSGSGGDSDSTSSSTSTGTTSDTTTTTGATTTTTTTTTGETTGETTGDTGGAVGECVVDGDCQLFSDCCSCQATPAGEEPDTCEAACEETRCEVLGVDAALCSFGTCTTSRVKCDDSGVVCNVPPPACPAGLLPQVNEAGDCWTGECVRGIQCESVPSCDDCPGNGWTCVTYVGFINELRCEPLPPACDGTPSCECAADVYCDAKGYELCQAEGDGVQCICPNC